MNRLPNGTKFGPYRVVGWIGSGGAADVFEAFHDGLSRSAAIKVLHSEHIHDPDMMRRFFTEARAVNLIDHPAIVQTYDFGVLPDGRAYLIMEYLRGESLEERRMRSGGRLPAADVARLGHLVADALAAVHAQRVIHRDLKPENILIVRDPNVPGGERVKILDFGIAKLADTPACYRTRPNRLLGTALFMAPEQWAGSDALDDRTDVYALGVTLYMLLSGQPPIDGEDVDQIARRHIFQEVTSLHRVAPQVPQRLATLVEGLLRKDPRQRPTMQQTAAELSNVHEDFEDANETCAMSLREHPTLTTPKLGRSSLREGGRRRAAVVIGALAALLCGCLTTVGMLARLAPHRPQLALSEARPIRERSSACEDRPDTWKGSQPSPTVPVQEPRRGSPAKAPVRRGRRGIFVPALN